MIQTPRLGIHPPVLEGEPLITSLHHRIAVKASFCRATDLTPKRAISGTNNQRAAPASPASDIMAVPLPQKQVLQSLIWKGSSCNYALS